jgi:hypothetical protein
MTDNEVAWQLMLNEAEDMVAVFAPLRYRRIPL